jgi:hypothetical protein
MNAVLDTLNMAMNTVLAAMLANIHATEWGAALLMIGGAWLLTNKRRNAALGFTLLLLAVAAGAWLSWKTGHTGASVQQVALAVLSLHGLLRARGWALVRGYAQ